MITTNYTYTITSPQTIITDYNYTVLTELNDTFYDTIVPLDYTFTVSSGDTTFSADDAEYPVEDADFHFVSYDSDFNEFLGSASVSSDGDGKVIVTVLYNGSTYTSTYNGFSGGTVTVKTTSNNKILNFLPSTYISQLTVTFYAYSTQSGAKFTLTSYILNRILINDTVNDFETSTGSDDGLHTVTENITSTISADQIITY